MTNVLYIGHDFSDHRIGGNLGRKNHYNSLKKLYGENLYEVFYEFNREFYKILKNYLFLEFNGENKKKEKEIFKIIKEKNIGKVILDSSILGGLAKKIKKFDTGIEIIIFFHNIERNFYLERIKAEGISRSILLPSIIFNENLGIKYGDKLILLNIREINELNRIYKSKIKNKKIYEIPIYLEDKYIKNSLKNCNYDYLFIGSAFFANIHGISWFIENILPKVKGKLLIIGKGTEFLREKYKEIERLEIKGTVEDISKYYYENNIIVSPIFYGAGMKTKTIEAMMFNKLIVGTNEAFVGIKKEDISKLGFCCNNTDEFIQVLKKLEYKKLEANSREIYLRRYSFDINTLKLKEIIEEKL